MNSYNKVLISVVAALATQTTAFDIHNSCLSLSDATIGQPDYPQQFVTNESVLTSDATTSDMKLDGFTICTEGNSVVGLQFFLTDTPYLGEGYAELMKLDPIGTMTGNCGSLRMTGPVDKIKVASKRNNGIQGIKFHYDGKVAEIGDMDGFRVNKQKWTFTEDNMLIGAYGESSPNGIEKLGFISHNLKCQAALDASEPLEDNEEMDGETVIVDLTPVNNATIIPNENPEAGSVNNESTDTGSTVNFDKLDNLDTLEPVEQPKEESGLAASTWLIIVFATIGFLVILVLTVVALKRNIK